MGSPSSSPAPSNNNTAVASASSGATNATSNTTTGSTASTTQGGSGVAAWRTRPLRAVHRSRLGSVPWRSLSTECSADVFVRRVPSGSVMAHHEYLLLARHFPVTSVGARHASVQPHGDIH